MGVSIEEVLRLVVPALRPDDDLDDADLAAVATVGLSPWRAQRVITALLGESPARHRRRLRLDRAEAAAGPPWESYLTDPGETPDPADWRTEVIWPLTD